MNKEKDVLVVSQHGVSWSLPKGHIEEGEDEIDALYRELYEETGLKKEDLTLHKKLGTYGRWSGGKDGRIDKSEWKEITLYFLTTDVSGPLQPVDPDNPEARWVNQRDVDLLLTHIPDKEFFLKIRKDLSINLDKSIELVKFRSYVTIFEAEAAKKILEAHGINAIFQTLLPVGEHFSFGNRSGGVLFVRSEDLEKAEEILESAE